MKVAPGTGAGTTLLDSPDLICVGTTRDEAQVGLWEATLTEAGIPVRTQTISVRQRGEPPDVVYLLYVRPSDEEAAMRALEPRPDLPIFPLAHLRQTAWW